jgi:peptidylprolyl isomerase
MKKLLLFLGALTLSGCLDATGPSSSDPATETFATSLGVDLTQMTKTSSGTYYKDEFVGTGAQLSNPTTSTNVNVDYSGYIKNGTLFDTNTGVSFPLGGLIVGFIDGMIGMKVGGTRLIVIPSELGYGNSTQTTPRATIPPNSTLIFRVKLNAFTL